MSQENLLPEQRRQKMTQLIRSRGVVHTRELAKELGTSMMTVRRDLKWLEERNYLQKTWGGAVPCHFQAHDIPYASKASHRNTAKQAIAKAARELVEEDACIILDAGTTSLELAKLLTDCKLTVITNDLQIAFVFAAAPKVSVFMAGGSIDPVSKSCIDIDTIRYFESVRASVAFIGTNVWDMEQGVTTSSREKMLLKEQMMKSAAHSVLLADSSKYACFSTWKIAGLSDFSCIVTDSELGQETCDLLQQSGVPLQTAVL